MILKLFSNLFEIVEIILFEKRMKEIDYLFPDEEPFPEEMELLENLTSNFWDGIE